MTIIIGLPNAGKTTLSEAYESVLHYDDISKYSKEQRDEIYRSTKADCIEGIFNSVKSRKHILALTGREYNTVIWLDTPVSVCLEREHAYRCRPDSLVMHHAKIFEPPTYAEGWDEIIVIRDGEEIHLQRGDE